MILVGDVGGTKTVLALVSAASGPQTLLGERVFPSVRYPDLISILREYLGSAGESVESACLGVAGPVMEGSAHITNLPWVLEESQLRDALGLRSVRLLNDLEAIASAVPALEPTDLHVLNAGRRAAGGALAVIAPGTGLGEAYATWDGRRYVAHAGEGGHTDFAPTDALQLDLLRWMLAREGHVSNENLCSGLGIPNLYAYLRAAGYALEPAWLAERLAQAGDPTPVIVNAALERAAGSELCVAALDLVVTILGTEAGNLALKVLATGGVYLGGGIPPRILSALSDGRFVRAFCHKGPMSDLMRRMPVHVILKANAALLGAAVVGLQAEDEGRTQAVIEH